MHKILVRLMIFSMAMAANAAGSENDPVAHGRYLVIIAGCNDCHTPGYLPAEGQVPEDQWLLGDRFGWHGPWGTTYAPNLRLVAEGMTEAQWVAMSKALRARPPMPWFNLNRMNDDDLKAIYHYIRQLGPAGEPAPAYLPPGQEPPPPFATFPAPPQ